MQISVYLQYNEMVKQSRLVAQKYSIEDVSCPEDRWETEKFMTEKISQSSFEIFTRNCWPLNF